jgi:hypothetical protein
MYTRIQLAKLVTTFAVAAIDHESTIVHGA